MTKWLSDEVSGLRKDRSERPFKTNNRKQRDRGRDWARERTSILVSWAVDWRLGRIAGVISKISGTTTTTRPRDPKFHFDFQSSVFGLQSSVSFSFVSFDFEFSWPGRGGGKVLFELFARWDTHRCDVFCNLFRIRSPSIENSNNILSCSCANRD